VAFQDFADIRLPEADVTEARDVLLNRRECGRWGHRESVAGRIPWRKHAFIYLGGVGCAAK
jgi:hypothetical protein